MLATPWFFSIFPPSSVALTMLVVSLVAASGLALGGLKFKGLSLGIPGVMFTGLVFARILGPGKLNDEVMAFIRDFGLIVFVYAIGVQVGPGFFDSLRRNGLPLNLMAASIVLLGAILTVGISFATHTDMKAAVGLFAGATTNAPSFGSAGEALKSIHPNKPELAAADVANKTGPAFAISYPFGLVGVIVAMVVIRGLFKVNPQRDADEIERAEKGDHASLQTMNIKLTNPNLAGMPLERLSELQGSGVVISRVLHENQLVVGKPDTQVAMGDVLLAVGPREELSDLRLIAGEESKVDLRSVPSDIITRAVLVTKRDALGKSVDEMDLSERRGVAITRLIRAGMEFTAVGSLRLQFGDRVRVVGKTEAVDAAARELGDSARELNVPRLLPIFAGIALGVILGSIPIFIPSLPAPVKLGLASGPMIIAIILARIGRIGPLIWYMPIGASALLRELGIVLFLIAVGLQAGKGFFDNLFSPTGVEWLLLGAIITLVPLLVVGIIAAKFFGVRFLHVCGLLCGSMNSPSLAFTQTMTPSEAPAVAFATVYPLTMVMRVLLAQLIVLIFVH
jgi:putative transport protein